MIETFIEWKHRINDGETTNFAMYKKVGTTRARVNESGDYVYDPDIPVDENAPDEYEDEEWVDEFGRTWFEDYDEYGNSLQFVVHRVEDYIFTGKQYCPNCFIEIPRKGDYFECPICNWSFDIHDAEVGEGCPTMAAARDYSEMDDYNEIFEVHPFNH